MSANHGLGRIRGFEMVCATLRMTNVEISKFRRAASSRSSATTAPEVDAARTFSGAEMPDQGRTPIDGRVARFASPADATAAGSLASIRN